MKDDQKSALRIQAYLDGELSGAQARGMEKELSANPDARSLLDELRQTRELISDNELDRSLPRPPAPYWREIEQQIEGSSRRPFLTLIWPGLGPFLRWLTPVAVVGLIAIAFFFPDWHNAPSMPIVLHEVETASDVSAITYRSDREGVTAIWVQYVGDR